jgi:hypothetical protein
MEISVCMTQKFLHDNFWMFFYYYQINAAIIMIDALQSHGLYS